MRITHIITTLDRGGAENHLVDLVHAQLARKHKVQVLYLRGSGYWTDHLAELGVEVHGLHAGNLIDYRAVHLLRRYLQSYFPTLIHAHLQPSELYAAAALRGPSFTDIPLVFTRHNMGDFLSVPRVAADALARWCGKRASALICISEAVRRDAVARKLTPDSCAVTIPYGINIKRFEHVAPDAIMRVRERWRLRPHTLAYGTVSRLVKKKSVDTLLRGYSQFCHAHPSADTRLILVGSGPLAGELRGLAEQLGILEQCVWEDSRSDIPEVMGAIDVFALTSLSEGFGLVLLEAMAAGKPVVATRTPSINEVVLDGKTGLLISTRSPDELAAAFTRCLLPETRTSLGFAGRARARLFPLAAVAEATELAYRAVLEGTLISRVSRQRVDPHDADADEGGASLGPYR